MIKPTIIELLLLVRRRKGWTQVECARRLGVPIRTYIAWEAGTRNPKPLVVRSIKAFVEEHS